MPVADHYPVCWGPYDDWPRCNRGDCHDGRWSAVSAEKPPVAIGDQNGAFRRDLAALLNEHKRTVGTPGYVLARYLTDCLTAWDAAITEWRKVQR